MKLHMTILVPGLSLPGKVNCCASCCVMVTWGEGWAGDGGVAHAPVINNAGLDGVDELHEEVLELESGTWKIEYIYTISLVLISQILFLLFFSCLPYFIYLFFLLDFGSFRACRMNGCCGWMGLNVHPFSWGPASGYYCKTWYFSDRKI